MVREDDDRLDALHVKILEIVEEAVEEGETPFARVRPIMDNPEITVTKPTVHARLDDLEEWGYVDRMKVGRAFILWPADKYEDMAGRLDELEADKGYLERRVDELEKEKEAAREEAVEARARQEAAERLDEQAALSPNQFLAPELPTPLPDELEHRWRIRANAWRHMLARTGIGIAALFLTIAGLVGFGRGLFGAIPVLQKSSVNVAVGIFGFFLIIVSVLFVWYLLAQVVAIAALSWPRFAPAADRFVGVWERVAGSGVPEEGESEPDGTDHVLAEAKK